MKNKLNSLLRTLLDVKVSFEDHPDKSKFDLKSESGLRGVMAGAMCPAALLKGLKDEFNLRIFVAYGTTENSPVTFMSTKNDSFENQTETVGYIMPHTEAKIVDEDGATVARKDNFLFIKEIEIYMQQNNE